MTIKEAKTRGLKIYRRAEYYATDENGVQHALYPDWHLEWFIWKRRKKGAKR